MYSRGPPRAFPQRPPRFLHSWVGDTLTVITLEILAFILIEFVFSAIGWLCLIVWFRDKKKIQKIRDEKYAGQYSGAGRVFILNFIAGLGAITMFGVVIVLLVMWIYKAISN